MKDFFETKQSLINGVVGDLHFCLYTLLVVVSNWLWTFIKKEKKAQETVMSQQQQHQLRTTGATLFGVIFSIAVTVAFGIQASWWIKLIVGLVVLILLVLLVKVATSRSGESILAHGASWLVSGY